MTNSRLTVASHVLTALSVLKELVPNQPINSQRLAESVNTNPVVIRRILGQLKEAGLVNVIAGAKGGAELARPAHEISLWDVHQALGKEEIFALHPNKPAEWCMIGSQMQGLLQNVFYDVESALQSVLTTYTIADFQEAIRADEA